jgi:hypothetical protein
MAGCSISAIDFLKALEQLGPQYTAKLETSPVVSATSANVPPADKTPPQDKPSAAPLVAKRTPSKAQKLLEKQKHFEAQQRQVALW